MALCLSVCLFVAFFFVQLCLFCILVLFWLLISPYASHTNHVTMVSAIDTTLPIEDILTTTTFVTSANIFTCATLSSDISISTGATLETHIIIGLLFLQETY